MRLLDAFHSVLSNICHGNDDRCKNFGAQFLLCILKFYDCTKFHSYQVAGEKVINNGSPYCYGLLSIIKLIFKILVDVTTLMHFE